MDSREDDVTLEPYEPQLASAPSAASLRSPVCVGWLLKRGYQYGCIPTWKRRYCIMQGAFIFKFAHPAGTRPKGVPIPVVGCTIERLAHLSHSHSHHTSHANNNISNAKPICAFQLSLLRKEYIFGCTSEEEMKMWMDSIQKQKQVCIKQELGHLPVSQADAYAQAAGNHLMQQRLSYEADEVERRYDADIPYAR